MPAAMLRARYLITGSVTRFGTEERRGLGGIGGRFGLGALGFKRSQDSGRAHCPCRRRGNG
jgi:hypothetical protein